MDKSESGMEEASNYEVSSIKNGNKLEITTGLISCALCLLLILAFLSLIIQSKNFLRDVPILKMTNASFFDVPHIGNA